MRVLLTILLVVAGFCAVAQNSNSRGLEKAVVGLDRALMSKDSTELKRLLNEHLSYGHSNGWVQTKNDAVGDLFNGKLTYNQIKSSSPSLAIEGDIASVRTVADVDVTMDGKSMQLKLKVLQVWVWKKKHWELFARQSVKA